MSFWPLDITKACQSGQLGWSFHILLYILPFLGLQQYAWGMRRGILVAGQKGTCSM